MLGSHEPHREITGGNLAPGTEVESQAVIVGESGDVIATSFFIMSIQVF